jgi:hypothetical protein
MGKNSFLHGIFLVMFQVFFVELSKLERSVYYGQRCDDDN